VMMVVILMLVMMFTMLMTIAILATHVDAP
jgi:hypothetical protein